MSEESSSSDVAPSPSLLRNLRQFRFQKNVDKLKQTDSVAKSSPDVGTRKKTVRRIQESDTDEEIDSPVTVNAADIRSREISLRALVDAYPTFDKMVLQDTLVRNNWNVELSKAQLIQQNYSRQGKRTLGDYKTSIGANKKAKKELDNIEEEKVDDDDEYDNEPNMFSEKVFNSDDSDEDLLDEITRDQKHVLEFFSMASLKEISTIRFCSQKKAEAIVEMRPFETWKDLLEKLKSGKCLSTELLNSAQEFLLVRQQVEMLMNKCMKLSKRMETAILAGASGIEKQPSLLNNSLKLTGYQMVGLNWLLVMNDQDLNGILADEMGLGKTVQVIAFFAHLKEKYADQETAHHPHVVVVPASTLDNWKNEFDRWCPSLKVVVYYGSQYDRKAMRVEWVSHSLKEIDVILTTYTIMTSTPEEKKMFRVLKFEYVVIDEAHLLKNMMTQRYDAMMRINADHRILLTGTPLQNNLVELMSLLIFVMPKMFAGKKEHLKALFSKSPRLAVDGNAEDEKLPPFEQNQVAHARRIMKPFVLRRLKVDVLKDLPKKTVKTLHCPLIPSQKEKYEELIIILKNSASNNSIEFNWMSMMMQLRKISNHPLLLRYYYQEDTLMELAKILAVDPTFKTEKEEHVLEDLSFMSDFEIHQLTQEKGLENYYLPSDLILVSGKFKLLDEILPKLKDEGHRVLIFSQFVIMLNVLEAYMKLRDHQYLRLDGSTPVPIRQDLIDTFNTDTKVFIFLVSTRAGGIGINLTAADTVIIHDIDFNPHNDKQAEDRCHRVGQSREVTVIRLVSEGTIEEMIYEKAQEKLSLEREINSEDCKAAEAKNVQSLLKQTLGLDSSRTVNSSKKS